MLSRAIIAKGWVAGGGSEDYDRDLEQTLMNILAARGLCDPDSQYATLPVRAKPGHELSALRQAIIDHTHGDLFWIGEILLNELKKETGFGPALGTWFAQQSQPSG